MLVGILSILLASVLVQGSSALQLPEQYLGWPLWKGLKSGSLDRELFTDIHFTAGSSPEMVMSQLKSFYESGVRSRAEDYESAESLLQLDDGERECSWELDYEFLKKYQAYKITEKTEEHPEVLLNFLEHYGQKKFPACAHKAIEDIESEFVVNSEDYKKQAKFFKLALSLDDDVDDSKFYAELKQFKPLESKINVTNLEPECEQWAPNKPAAERIDGEFRSICHAIKEFARAPMNTLVLANHFAPNVGYFEKNPRIGAVNEMRRACLDVHNNNGLLEHLKKL